MHEIESSPNPFDALRREDHEGEHWTAREIVSPLGYAWRRFVDAIERARTALRVNGQDPDMHIRRLTVPSNGWSASGRAESRTDYRLTREGVYAIIQGGDPRKPEIAAGWAYFRTKTREAELLIPRQRSSELDLGDVSAQLAEIEAANIRAMQAVALARQQFERANAAETKLGIAAPKADAWDALASAEGDYSVADAAKILCRDPRIRIGRDQLFDLMGEWGWLFRQKCDDRWRPYGNQVQIGRLGELPTYRMHPVTGEKIKNVPQVRVTAKGLKDIRERMVQPPSSGLEAVK